MKLLHLKIACYLYNQFTDYDKKYLEFSRVYKNLNINKKKHIVALVQWLRAWGCRQFKTKNEDISISNIKKWYKANKSKIPAMNQHLISYNISKNEKSIAVIFDNLSKIKVANRERKLETSEVHVGPVGAAKILFALRPNLFAPWDKSIYEHFEFKGNGIDYVQYLTQIKKELMSIRKEFIRKKMKWVNLFRYLEKEHRSYPKLIDEFYWIEITNKCEPEKIINKIYQK